MSGRRQTSLIIGFVVVTPLLLAGGCFGLVYRALESPPSTDTFLPLQPGIEMVDNVTYDEAQDDRTWHVREVVLRSTDGRTGSDLLNYVGREYGNYNNRQIYQGVDGRLYVELVAGREDQVRLKYARSS